MIWKSKKFAAVTLGIETFFIITYAFFVSYGEEPGPKITDLHLASDSNKNPISNYYPMFQDVNVMIFIGFGFLMTFLKKYGFGAVGLNFLLSAIAIQWGILMQGVWSMQDGRIPIDIVSLINGNFAAAAVLISYGALLGKTSPVQLIAMCIFEISIYACNLYLGTEIIKAVDVGGSIFVHTFGAYFGLGVSAMLFKKELLNHSKEGSNYHSDIFAMIGTVFLWMFWPSFNSALTSGYEQQRCVINTIVALLSSCVITFAMSSLVDAEGRLNMVHIQNATLAGGVAVGSTANLIIHPFGAMMIGALAAILSTLGYKLLTPLLANKIRIHDTCGVNNLHGMPGILAGLASAIVASLANEANYGYNLYELYPARAPLENSTDWHRIGGFIKGGDGWSEVSQAYAQLEALFATLTIAFIGGASTGYIIRHEMFDPIKKTQLYDDVDVWEVPDDDNI